MKKIFLLSVIALSLTANAQETVTNGLADVKPDFKIIEPSYMDDYILLDKWSQHWFFGVQGGASAFIGDPSVAATCTTEPSRHGMLISASG